MKQKQTIMPVVEYSLDQLKDLWDESWKDYEIFCRTLGFQRCTATYGGEQSKVELLRESTREIVDNFISRNAFDFCIGLHVQICKDLSSNKTTFKKNSHSHKESKTRTFPLSKVLKPYLFNLISSDTVEEVCDKTMKDLKFNPNNSFIKSHIAYIDIDSYIPDYCKDAFTLLLNSLNNKIEESEAWWNCAWLFTKIKLEELKAIENNINSDIPLTKEQSDTVNGYLAYGSPRGHWAEGCNGKKEYRLYLKIEHDWMNMHDLSRVATTVLIQPAFILAQRLQQKTSIARYIASCRAPSCNKRFYTGCKNATACPGSQDRKKNKCALEWTRYTRYLKKTGKDPKFDWDNAQLQKDFLKYDES